MWIDTHVHMDDDRYPDPETVRAQARAAGVGLVVIPSVGPANFEHVRLLAHTWGDGYALGIHPMYIPDDMEAALAALEQALARYHTDPHLVAVGEIGLDFFVPALTTPEARARQAYCLRAQLRLARRYDLPVLLHVRKSVDGVVQALRQLPPVGAIAHAWSGSDQQAQTLVDMGVKLGLGGAMTFERATRLRAQAAQLPLTSLVLETDAPDIAPSWLYTTAQQRAAGAQQGLNTPAQVPAIGQVLAQLRGMPVAQVGAQTTANAYAVLPKLRALAVIP